MKLIDILFSVGCESESGTSPPKITKGKNDLIEEVRNYLLTLYILRYTYFQLFLIFQKMVIFRGPLLKVSDADTRGELRGKIHALVENAVEAKLEIIANQEEKTKLLVQNEKGKSEKVIYILFV